MIDNNEEYAKIKPWKDMKCKLCGRGVDQTKINFEGGIHHNSSYVCLDTKSCRRYRRKHPMK